MINDPILINKVLKNIERITPEELDEAIKEVDKEGKKEDV